MTIRIYNNKIMIGSYTIQEGSGGLVFDGSIKAESLLREGSFQGTVAGFTSAGYGGSPSPFINVIDKFSFATEVSNATDQGDLTVARYGNAGISSDSHGYTAGGYGPSGSSNIIDKFPFAANGNAFDVGDLSQVTYGGGGNSSKQFGIGFSAGSAYPTGTNIIDKIPFATDSNGFDVGDLTVARGLQAGQTSTTHAYNSGGEPVSGNAGVNTIDKFPMAATSYVLATDVGDLTAARGRVCGQSSLTHGYSSGGTPTWPPNASWSAVIDKFPFSSDSNATSVGSLTSARAMGSGTSSTVAGYTGGGSTSQPTTVTTIDKFPFSTDYNAVSVGSLTVARSHCAGMQI